LRLQQQNPNISTQVVNDTRRRISWRTGRTSRLWKQLMRKISSVFWICCECSLLLHVVIIIIIFFFLVFVVSICSQYGKARNKATYKNSGSRREKNVLNLSPSFSPRKANAGTRSRNFSLIFHNKGVTTIAMPPILQFLPSGQLKSGEPRTRGQKSGAKGSWK